ncbi:MAG: hypothetical protein EOP45_02395 [Sphingobacteriaceae bacterium]|nr:MAG: hypothetical protein EOP45_02395 [Sphingobacteriaceae bacterium]
MIILILLLAGIAIALIVSTQNASERKQLWSAYQQSLRAGRAYYTKLRKGRLSAADEQALTNDLSTMNV